MQSFPVDWAAVSTLGAPFEIQTVSASDVFAAQLNELQIDVGEGPCWEAYLNRSEVFIPDLADSAPTRWPLFSNAISTMNVAAIYSFPLSVGTLKIGAIDLYTEAANTLTSDALVQASVLAGVTATDVLRHALEHRHDDAENDGPHSRREVHQATGMIIAQMHIGAADALLLLRAHAFASGRTVRETAAEITARRITFEP